MAENPRMSENSTVTSSSSCVRATPDSSFSANCEGTYERNVRAAEARSTTAACNRLSSSTAAPPSPAVAARGLAPTRKPLGDDRINRRPSVGNLPDGSDQLVALCDPILQQVGQPALALAEEGDGVGLVVVGGEHDDAGLGMLGPDLVGAVDPLELEVRRHLDVGHADDLDVLEGVEQGSHTLTDQDVVLAQHDPDAHAARPYDACTIPAWYAWSSPRITTWFARGPRRSSRPPGRSTSSRWPPPTRS